MNARAAAFGFLFSLVAGAAGAVEPDEILADPALEARAREVSKDLRCMVCRAQSIDDSDAPLAKDLRILVRERIQKGDTNRQVLDYVAARYGDYVLLKPRVGATTYLLWGAPALALLFGMGAAFVSLRAKAKSRPALAPLSDEEVRRLDELAK